jgi:hypothetical protein
MRKFVFLISLFILSILQGTDLKPVLPEKSFYMGQEISVKIDVNAKEKMSASFLQETKDVSILGVKQGDDGASVIVRIITLVSGEVSVPGIALTIDGSLFNIEPFKVTSMDRTAENDMNLRDIKDTVKIMEKDYTLLYVLLALLGATVLIFIFLKLKKRFTKKAVIFEKKVEPSEVAARFIKEAKEKRENGDNEAFVDLSTIGLKTYMSLISTLNYTEMTTSEVRRKLKKDTIFSSFNELITGILKLGDRFKFADDELSMHDLDKIIEGFISIVKEVESQKVKKNDAA